MKDNSPGRIYLADQRAVQETDWFRIYATFNAGHREPFGALYALNDETLAGGHQLDTVVQEDSYLWLLPVVGAVTFSDSQGNDTIIAAGEMMFTYQRKGDVFTIGNPYSDPLQLVNYMTILLKTGNAPVVKAPRLFTFDIASNNTLEKWHINGLPGLTFGMGKYDGRSEGTYALRNPEKGAYAIVIQGAFEVNGRLLHERDGVALWDTPELEFEALSNQAIIFLIEAGV
jgi:quercetin 2,3-dioxygenase